MMANFPTGRRGSSRSPPPRQDSRDHQGDLGYDDFGRDGGANRPHRDGHDYSGMYDDDDGRGASDAYRQGHHGDDRDHRDRRGGYRDRDDPSARSSPRGYRSRSQSPTREAGRPSDTVILEGLPFTVSASELQESILRNSVAAEFSSIDVRVSSTKGQRRAFVQFESTDYAVTFIREHFPKLLLEMPQPTDEVPDGKYNVYLHYARSRDDTTDHRASNSGNWICSSCDFSNYPTRSKCKICGAAPAVGPDWQQSLTGQADAANVPSQILVVYPVAGFVNEDMLAGDMKRLELEKANPAKDTSNGAPKLKSTAPTGNTSGLGARPGSLHRVFLMRDIYNDESFKYGFAEFWTVEDATAAMAKFQAARSFNVGAVAVNISTIHMGVFLPEERDLTPDIERMSFHPLFNPSLRVRYRDHRLWPSQKVVTTEPPDGRQTKTSSDDANDSKKSKKRKAEGSIPSTNKKPVAMAGQMAMWQRKHVELHGQNGGEKGPEEQGNSSRRSPDKGPQQDPNAPIKISLSGAKIGGTAPAEASKRSISPDKPAPTQSKPGTATDTPAISYVDRERLMCLICMRKYKSVDEVNIHEKSRNHKTSTEDPELVKAAQPRLAARDKRLQKQGVAPEAGPSGDTVSAESQYRDRAKERRQVYQQPKKAAVPASSKPSNSTNKPKADEPTAVAKPPQPSKGAGMLAKMGWTTGAGLGANGEGRTEVIETNAYQEGVGLGAEGSNLGDAAQLAERKTKNSYAEYVSTVQDRARERYNKMGQDG